MVKQFRYDLVRQVVATTMDVFDRGVELGMGKDEVLAAQAMINQEIQSRLLVADFLDIMNDVLGPDNPEGGPKGPKKGPRH